MSRGLVNSLLLRDQLSSRIVADLDNWTCQDEKDAHAYLDLLVTATPEAIDIKGYVQPQLHTTEQQNGMFAYLCVGPLERMTAG